MQQDRLLYLEHERSTVLSSEYVEKGHGFAPFRAQICGDSVKRESFSLSVPLSRRSGFLLPDLEPWCDGNYSDGLWQYMYAPLCTSMHHFMWRRLEALEEMYNVMRGSFLVAALIHWSSPDVHDACQVLTTQLTMGGRKRKASYFQSGPRCPSPRICSTCMWSALGQLPALSANAWRQSWSGAYTSVQVHIHARSSWTRIISNTNMYIRAW